ncbi:MAG: hypothetical protein R3E95_18140 [Thiolinea sp.]
MIRLFMLLFAGLTVGAAALTYYNVGLEETYYDDAPSIRAGSAGYVGSGGYRSGK